MSRILTAVLTVNFGFGMLALADTVYFNLAGGDLGSNSHTFKLNHIGFVATGFNGGDLFGKDVGTGELGLGLTERSDHEIAAGPLPSFVQLDLFPLVEAGFSNFRFQMASSTGNDRWQVSSCSKPGVQGFGPACAGSIYTLAGTDQNFHTAPTDISAANHFLDFRAANGDVLLQSISASLDDPPPFTASAVPEPEFAGVLLAGMIAMAGLAGRLSKTRLS